VKVLEKAKPEIIYVFVPNVSENYFLKDYRLLQSYGEINFGTIGQVAKNLGVSYKKKEDGLIMFIEKLHFSLIEYMEV
jgi:hypothetical protein